MSDQTDNKDVIINKTLRVLIQQNDLTPEEVAQLRLSHLHLAGKNPSISFMPEGFQESKVVTLDMETHRALVGWLVNRPDSTSDFLFPGNGGEAMSPDAIRQAIEQAEALSPPSASGAEPSKPVTPPEAGPPGPAGPPSNSRPVRPLSRPEVGAPPPGVGPTGASFTPPPTAPEEDETITTPLPTRPPSSPLPAKPAGPPRTPSGPISRPESAPSASAASSPAKTGAAAATPDPEATLIGAKKPEIKAKEEKTTLSPSSEKPSEKPMPASAKKDARVEPPLAAKKVERPLAQQAMQQRSGRSRVLIPGIIGLVVGCALCLGAGWFIGQTESGSQFLASLGLPVAAIEETPTGLAEETSEAVVFESALPTATLPPTATSTSLPATNTPLPTDTPIPTDTPTLAATDTPTPTETLEPTDTPEAEETSEPPTATSTPGLKYSPLEIVEPRDGFDFIRGNTIVLRWNPVDLAPDEQYAVRLVYQYQGQPTYQGANIKEPNWTMPLSLFGVVDGPDNRYEWFVVVERLNDDGSGTAISPESEHRTFTWK